LIIKKKKLPRRERVSPSISMGGRRRDFGLGNGGRDQGEIRKSLKRGGTAGENRYLGRGKKRSAKRKRRGAVPSFAERATVMGGMGAVTSPPVARAKRKKKIRVRKKKGKRLIVVSFEGEGQKKVHFFVCRSDKERREKETKSTTFAPSKGKEKTRVVPPPCSPSHTEKRGVGRKETATPAPSTPRHREQGRKKEKSHIRDGANIYSLINVREKGAPKKCAFVPPPGKGGKKRQPIEIAGLTGGKKKNSSREGFPQDQNHPSWMTRKNRSTFNW